MRPSAIFVSATEAEELHLRLINLVGGTPGMADPNLIESIIFLPHSGYEDKQIRHLNFDSIFDQAAVLLFGFCTNKGFKDGNRATGLLISLVFLRMNGFTIKASNEELVTFVQEQVVTKKADIKAIARWLESHRS